ncbi:two-component system sensor histidine kinase NtrB [Anaeromyxobacter paludicola]|uniref:histidine kinase n=1 Tax=Anaeromyxobacter paludicola TaxID=2918171 RepID=A0ABM7XAD2_9BACT|nr:ATP-binding protein [Anaeromyxobacter paludicola]BDG08811.1 hypothetical protein AMPC_19240 [Anaeromyxobacter paludicola]
MSEGAAPRAVRAPEKIFQALVEQSGDALLLLGAGGEILYASPSVERVTGYRPELLLGRELRALAHPEDEKVLAGAWRRCLERPGEPVPASFRYRHYDGSWRHAETVSVDHLADPELAAVVTSVRDVTERRLMESRLAFTDRIASVGSLAAGVAHEINNPLSYVISNLSYLAEALAGQPGLPDEVHSALREAAEGAERVRRIVRDIRAFSRPDDERHGPVDLKRVVEGAISLASNELRHRAKLVRDLGEGVLAWGNEARVGQVALNLLVNAAQAIARGSAAENEIRVSTRRVPEGVELTVRDTGSGMPPEVQARIFDPFFTTKPVGVGTGLGLFICQRIVAELRGSISVESEPGRGTTFRVVFPEAPAP